MQENNSQAEKPFSSDPSLWAEIQDYWRGMFTLYLISNPDLYAANPDLGFFRCIRNPCTCIPSSGRLRGKIPNHSNWTDTAFQPKTILLYRFTAYTAPRIIGRTQKDLAPIAPQR